MNGKHGLVAALALGLIAAPVLAATPADLVKARVTGYKALGKAFKAVNDGLRGGSPSPAMLRQSAATIKASARNQYRWYPAASKPKAGIETDAKLAIWNDPKGFRARQDAFARQAAAFQRAVAGGDAALIKGETRKLGAACKGCHDTYRVEDD